ncbi:hypothetical protein R1sor_009775 [Riccia sorocarpa]|uniref:Uncharacterized protein n=1 Tax=Riccia sorocarpa TaxID=122646 RepID=A0ABD3HZG2_9MARC
MLRSWYRARQKLRRKKEGCELDAGMSLFQVKIMHHLSIGEGIRTVRPGRDTGLLTKAGIGNFEDAREITRNGGWKLFLWQKGIFPEEAELSKLEELESWCSKQILVWKEIMDLDAWSWESPRGAFRWSRSTQEWRLSFAKDADFSEKLDGMWQHQSMRLEWHQRWTLLWAAPIPYRRKESRKEKKKSGRASTFISWHNKHIGMDRFCAS